MKQLLYSIVDIADQFKSAYVDVNGDVQWTVDRAPLNDSPKGWEDSIVGWETDPISLGNKKTTPTKYLFTGDGAQIISELTLGGSKRRRISLVVQAYDPIVTSTHFSENFKTVYVGNLLYQDAVGSDEEIECSVEMTAPQTAFEELRGKDYEFKENGEEIVINFDGMPMIEKLNYQVADVGDVTMTSYTVPVAYTSSEGKNYGAFPGSQFADSITAGGGNPAYYQDQANDNNLLKVIKTFLVRLKGNLKIKCNQSGVSGAIRVDLMKNTVAPSTFLNLMPITPMVAGQIKDFPFDVTFTMNAGEVLFMRAGHIISSGDPGLWKIQWLSDGKFDINFKSRQDPYKVKAYKPSTIFKRLCKEMFTGISDWESTMLDADRKFCFTSNEMIRNLTDWKFKTSWDKFYKTINLLNFSGYKFVSGKFRVEKGEDFFSTNLPRLNLGTIDEGKFERAKDYIYDALTFFYPTQNYEDINGRDEWNQNITYSQADKFRKELKLESGYRGDAHGPCYEALSYLNKETVTSNSDNDIFILRIDYDNPNQDGSYNLKRVPYTYTEGLNFPADAFNIEDMTYKRLLNVWRNFVYSSFYFEREDELKVTASEKNIKVKTRYANGIEFDEDLPFKPSQITGNLLFYPITFSFFLSTDVHIIDAVDNSLGTIITVQYKDLNVEGFMLKGTEDLTLENGRQGWKILLTPNNDINKIKRLWKSQ